MGNVFDFLRAALPWIVIGLTLAVFCVRSERKKKEKDTCDHYGTEGMCLGMCFGTAIGTSLWNNTGIGISLGILIGLAVGSSIKKKEQNNDHDET